MNRRIKYKLTQMGHDRSGGMAFVMSEEEKRELDGLTLDQVVNFMKVSRTPQADLGSLALQCPPTRMC